MDKNFGLTDEHALSSEEFAARLKTNLELGLTSKAARQLLSRNGPNRFSRPKPSTFQRWIKRERPIWSELEWNQVFNSQLADKARVRRDNKLQVIEGTKVVAGDVVMLKVGDKAPGDLRIITSHDLVVNNRLITGEKNVGKSEFCTSKDPLLSENIMFACTKVIRGECTALVFRTGDETVFGQVNRFATKVMLPRQFSNPLDKIDV